MHQSRTSNSIKNILFSLSYQFLNLALGFINRTIFIRILGVEYLGIAGLFGDILAMLTLADLGFGTAMTFSMYKPLAENDQGTLAALINLYKKVYRTIALVITVIGISLIPFLKYLVNLENDMPYLTLYYVLFLANTVASYLVVYKTSILSADQKNYVLTKYNAYFSIMQTLVLTVLLLLSRSYIVYLIAQVVIVYVGNFYKSRVAEKHYPYINKKVSLPKEKSKKIFENIGSVFLYKISGVLINATDNTLISVMVGTIWVGYYSNYMMVVSRITGVVNSIFYSLTSSLGNLIVKESAERKFQIFTTMQSVSNILATVFVTCVLALEEDFIRLWLGKEYLLDNLVLCAIALNFYFSIVLLPIWVYREAAGLYRKTKFVMLGTAVVNIISSIILGKFIGLAGILFATSFSRLVTYFWYEPLLLFKDYFDKSSMVYYKGLLKGVIGTVVAIDLSYYVTVWFTPGNVIELIFKGCIVGGISLIIIVIIYCKDEGFIMLWKKMKEMICNRIINRG